MLEELEQTEETKEAPKKVKKGFTLLSETIDLLEAKSKAVGHNQSKIVDAILMFGLPVYGENGMEDRKVITEAEWGKHVAGNVILEVDTTVPAIPVPEPVETKRGRAEKLRVPGMNTVPQPGQQVVDIQQQQDLYRPNLGPGSAQPEAGTHTPMAGNDRIASLEATMNLLMQHMSNMQMPQQQQPGYPQQAPPPPPPAPVFAASYPPGYTGPPGVGVATGQQAPQPQQGVYPLPGRQPQQRPDLQDPYAMNIGQSPGQAQGGLTAQGLLSGSQGMNPNVPGQNINMDIAKRALGSNWRDNLHQMQAQGMREEPIQPPSLEV